MEEATKCLYRTSLRSHIQPECASLLVGTDKYHIQVSHQNVECNLLLLVMETADLSLRMIKCCSVMYGVTLRLLVINISS